VLCVCVPVAEITCVLALPWRAHVERRAFEEPLDFAVALDLVALRLTERLLCDLWHLRFVLSHTAQRAQQRQPAPLPTARRALQAGSQDLARHPTPTQMSVWQARELTAAVTAAAAAAAALPPGAAGEGAGAGALALARGTGSSASSSLSSARIWASLRPPRPRGGICWADHIHVQLWLRGAPPR
jgi:hypothetical protein